MAQQIQPASCETLKQEIESELNHSSELDEKTMQIAVKKLANNKKFLGTKSEKLAMIKKISDEVVIGFMKQKNRKRAADDIKLLTSKLPLLHRAKASKEDVALVVFYIAEILYDFFSRFRASNKIIIDLVNPFRDAYTAVMCEAREHIEANNKNNLVRQSPEELNRLFLQGGGKLPDDEALRTCPFCCHSYVDEPSTNAAVFNRNGVLAADYEVKLREYHSNNGCYTKASGEQSNRAPPKPQYKHEVLQCHCHQITCVDAAGNGSCGDCNTNGSKLDSKNKCKCPVCSCDCRFAYKKTAVNIISINKGLASIAEKENIPDTGNAAAGKAIGSIFAASAFEAHAAQTAAIHARNGKNDDSDAFHTENLYFQGASRRLMVDPSINLSSLREFAGTAASIQLPNGAVYDTRLLGKENGGFRERNNRLEKKPAVASSNRHGSSLMGPPVPRNATSTVATISPIPAATATAVMATPPATLLTLGPFNPPPKKLAHRVPISASMKTFLSVEAAVNGTAGVRMPSAPSQAEVDAAMASKEQAVIDVLDNDDDDSSVVSVPSFERQKTDDTPSTAMVNETIDSVVECAYNPIINVDSPSSPDSALGRDVAHIIDLPFRKLRKIAQGILKTNKDAGPQDLKRLLDQAYPFPSSIKKKAKKEGTESRLQRAACVSSVRLQRASCPPQMISLKGVVESGESSNNRISLGPEQGQWQQQNTENSKQQPKSIRYSPFTPLSMRSD